jgi:hypothetical protein
VIQCVKVLRVFLLGVSIFETCAGIKMKERESKSREEKIKELLRSVFYTAKRTTFPTWLYVFQRATFLWPSIALINMCMFAREFRVFFLF